MPMIFSKTPPEPKNKFHTPVNQFSFCAVAETHGKLPRKIPSHIAFFRLPGEVVSGSLIKCFSSTISLKILKFHGSNNYSANGIIFNQVE
jgi:hypothetical protein